MLGLTAFYRLRIDPDVKAFIDASGITDETQISAITTLVKDLKDVGIWSKFNAIYPFVGGTSGTHKWNLVNPQDTNAAYRLSFVGSITHSVDGLLAAATNGYFNTHLNDSTLDVNSNFMSIYVRTNQTGTPICGTNTSSAPNRGYRMNPRNSSNLAVYRNFTGNNSVAETDSRGLFSMSRVNSTEFRGFKNKTATLFTQTALTATGFNIFGLTENNNGSAANSDVNVSVAFMAIGNQGLTVSEVEDFYDAIQNFQTTLGRQV